MGPAFQPVGADAAAGRLRARIQRVPGIDLCRGALYGGGNRDHGPLSFSAQRDRSYRRRGAYRAFHVGDARCGGIRDLFSPGALRFEVSRPCDMDPWDGVHHRRTQRRRAL